MLKSILFIAYLFSILPISSRYPPDNHLLITYS